ncbi:MAG: AMIN domain-containing protein [Clostridiaceae bacterium]|nr:AMIN domain-containing protein [Clostridiaceae bacterium]
MKKYILVLTAVVIILTNSMVGYAGELLLKYDGKVHKYTGNICILKVNNETVSSDIPPIIMNGRSLVPVRAIFEKLGAAVLWNEKDKKVSVSYNGTIVELTINDENAVINGAKVKMEVPAKIINDRTMVPLRFVGEQLNMKVGWNDSINEISVDSKNVSTFASLNEIKYSKKDGLDEVEIALDKYSNYRIMRLNEQDKIVIDFSNTKVLSEKKSIDVNNDIIKAVRCGQFDDETARVVLDVVGQPQYRLLENGSKLVLNLKAADASLDIADIPKNEQVPVADEPVAAISNELDVKHIVKSDHEEIYIRANDLKEYKEFFLNEPGRQRLVIDIPGASAPGKQQVMNINSKIISSVRYAQNEQNVARVVVDVKKDPEYKLVKQEGLLVVYIWNKGDQVAVRDSITVSSRSDGGREPKVSNNIDVKYLDEGNIEQIVMLLNDYKNYRIIKQIDYNRIFIDFPNAVGPEKEQRVDVKSDLIDFFTYQGVDKTSSRVIIELKDKVQYEVIEAKGKMAILFAIGSQADEQPKQEPKPTNTVKPATPKPEATKLETPKPETPKPETPKPETTKLETPKPETPKPEATKLETPKPETTKAEDSDGTITMSPGTLKIDYEIDNGFDKVILDTVNDKYSISRLSDPERIVIDLPDTVMEDEQGRVDVKGSFVDSIRYALNGKNASRVVIDLLKDAQYSTESEDGKLVVTVAKPAYKNITYHNNGDRIHFILSGIKLTEGGENLKNLYTDRFDSDGLQYTITFPNDLGDLGSGVMNINDGVLKNVKIIKNEDTNETSIVFTSREPYNYHVIARDYLGDTAITVLKRYSKGDKLVVIDPGHGGEEPGAVYGGVNEKDLNLDIALRLNELLKKKNIKTYMIREDDSYVGLYERAYIANKLNATLFLSIHNNAYLSSHKGTETLYYPQDKNDTSFNGKRFAQIIQDSLVGKLNTNYRKIIERPNLVVLKATKMDAALAEVAFLTNKEDLARLKTESFRQKAAEALCEAIIQSLSEVD